MTQILGQPCEFQVDGGGRDGATGASAWAWAVPASTPDTEWSVEADGRLAHPAPTPNPAAATLRSDKFAATAAAKLCLTTPDNAGVKDKQPLALQPCTDDLTPRQQFVFGNATSGDSGGGGGSNLVLKSSGLCVAMQMGTGPALVMFNCNTGANEDFRLSSSGSGSLCSSTLHGNLPKCVTVKSTSPSPAHPPHHPGGGGGGKVSPQDKLLTWVGELAHGAYVALLVNNQETATTLHFHVANPSATAAVTAARQPAVAADGGRLSNPPQDYTVTDLWKGATLPGVHHSGDVLTFPVVGAHDCVMLRFQPTMRQV